MKKSIKDKWIKALRSGEYKQIKGRLKRTNGFCCLGVLCDLYGKEKNVKWDDSHFLRDFSLLPDEVRDWANLKFTDPTVNNNKRFITLSNINDSGTSFKEIADIIEKQL